MSGGGGVSYIFGYSVERGVRGLYNGVLLLIFVVAAMLSSLKNIFPVSLSIKNIGTVILGNCLKKTKMKVLLEVRYSLFLFQVYQLFISTMISINVISPPPPNPIISTC